MNAFGLVRDYQEPSWVGNQRVLVFNYGFAEDVAVDPIGRGDENLIPLLDDAEGAQLGAGRAPPRAPLLITLRGNRQESGFQQTMRLYGVPEDGAPFPLCDFSGGVGGGFADPTISPNGRLLAWVRGTASTWGACRPPRSSPRTRAPAAGSPTST